MTEALLVGRLENVTPYGMAPSKPSPLKLAPGLADFQAIPAQG
jgi:hypothetical protein